jgi:hypothetical protein
MRAGHNDESERNCGGQRVPGSRGREGRSSRLRVGRAVPRLSAGKAIATQTIGARSGASRDSRAAKKAQRWPPQVDATSLRDTSYRSGWTGTSIHRQEACLQRSSGNASTTLNPNHRLHIGKQTQSSIRLPGMGTS